MKSHRVFRQVAEARMKAHVRPDELEEKWVARQYGGRTEYINMTKWDRRKGERRRHKEVISDDHLFNTGRRHIESGRLIWEGRNRRSGKDRRKP